MVPRFLLRWRFLLILACSLKKPKLTEAHIVVDPSEVSMPLELLGESFVHLSEMASNQSETDQLLGHHISKRSDPSLESILKMLTEQVSRNQEYSKQILSIADPCQVHKMYRVCDTKSSGSYWIVIQHRFDGSVSFHRSWWDYVNGFGDVKPSSEYWLGLERIYQITKTGEYELLIELKDERGEYRFARYSRFSITGADEDYRLSRLEGYSGSAGDVNKESSIWIFAGQKFTTYDRDHDKWSGGNCAGKWGGGWWFNDCGATTCLNRPYGSIQWAPWKSDSLIFTRMLLRAKF